MQLHQGSILFCDSINTVRSVSINYECSSMEKMSGTSNKSHFYKMKRDIGMADCENQVQQ